MGVYVQVAFEKERCFEWLKIVLKVWYWGQKGITARLEAHHLFVRQIPVFWAEGVRTLLDLSWWRSECSPGIQASRGREACYALTRASDLGFCWTSLASQCWSRTYHVFWFLFFNKALCVALLWYFMLAFNPWPLTLESPVPLPCSGSELIWGGIFRVIRFRVILSLLFLWKKLAFWIYCVGRTQQTYSLPGKFCPPHWEILALNYSP